LAEDLYVFGYTSEDKSSAELYYIKMAEDLYVFGYTRCNRMLALGLSIIWHPTEVHTVSHDHAVIFGRSDWLKHNLEYIFFTRYLEDNISISTDRIYTNLGLLDRSEPTESSSLILIKIGLVYVEIFAFQDRYSRSADYHYKKIYCVTCRLFFYTISEF
jgi:hypothetical protein